MAYSWKFDETIASGQITGGPLSNFPAVLSRTYNGTGGTPDLRFSGSGGKSQNSNLYDANCFTNASSAPGTLLDQETLFANGSTGQIIRQVRLASADVGTKVWWQYGDSGVSTSQDNATGVWNSNFVGVYHDGTPSSLSMADSTTGGNSLTNSSGVAASGKVYAAVQFDGTGEQSTSSANFLLTRWSIGAWLNSTDGAIGTISAFPTDSFFSYNSGSGVWEIGFLHGGPYAYYTYSTAPSTGTWYRMWYTYDGATMAMYINGSSVISSAETNTPDHAAGATYWARSANGSRRITGRLAERQFLSSGMTSAWITADYNNQNAPTTFWGLGSESSVGGAGLPRRALPRNYAINRAAFY